MLRFLQQGVVVEDGVLRLREAQVARARRDVDVPSVARSWIGPRAYGSESEASVNIGDQGAEDAC